MTRYAKPGSIFPITVGSGDPTAARGEAGMSVPEDAQARHTPIHFWAAFSIASIVILAAFAAVLVWLSQAPFSNQYPIILALVSFVLSTVACLLFTANAQIKATLPIAAVTAGGPAVVWVVTLLIVAYLFPPQPITTDRLVEILRKDELGQGWITFTDWMNRIGRLKYLVLKDEANAAKDALDTAYFAGSGRRKLINPNLHILYVYSTDNKTLKIQHITGNKQDIIAEIFSKGTPTLPGSARTALLVKENGLIVHDHLSGQGDWEDVRTEPLDCLTLTLYQEGMLPEGDILYIETAKYLEKKNGNTANISVGILAPQPTSEPRIWFINHFLFADEDEVPVKYSKTSGNEIHNVDMEVNDLQDWFDLLDKSPIPGSVSNEVNLFIEDSKNVVPGRKFANFYDSTEYQTRYSTYLDKVSNNLVVTLERK